MGDLARRLIGYRISIALGATVIALAIAALSGAWWALGYIYVMCDAICSVAAVWVNRADGARSQVAHAAASVVWLTALWITVPALAMQVWPQPAA